jgi:hypothetical protein
MMFEPTDHAPLAAVRIAHVHTHRLDDTTRSRSPASRRRAVSIAPSVQRRTLTLRVPLHLLPLFSRSSIRRRRIDDSRRRSPHPALDSPVDSQQSIHRESIRTVMWSMLRIRGSRVAALPILSRLSSSSPPLFSRHSTQLSANPQLQRPMTMMPVMMVPSQQSIHTRRQDSVRSTSTNAVDERQRNRSTQPLRSIAAAACVWSSQRWNAALATR